MSMQPIDSWLQEEEARRVPESFPCPVDGCVRVLASAVLLRGHLESEHAIAEEEAEMPEQTEDEGRVFPCDQCPRSFPSAQGLGIHRTRVHGPLKPRVAKRPSQNGELQDPELRALAGILRDVERLSPASRAWLGSRLTQKKDSAT